MGDKCCIPSHQFVVLVILFRYHWGKNLDIVEINFGVCLAQIWGQNLGLVKLLVSRFSV